MLCRLEGNKHAMYERFVLAASLIYTLRLQVLSAISYNLLTDVFACLILTI